MARSWRDKAAALIEKIREAGREVRLHPEDLADIFHHEIPDSFEHPFRFKHEDTAVVHGVSVVADQTVKRGTVG